MSNYTEKSKKIYNEVCDKYKHHWLDTTITQTMGMEMITKALAISRVGSAFYCQRDIEGDSICNTQCKHCDEYYKPLSNNMTANVSQL